MSLEATRLEERALEYAREAVELDKRGLRALAIAKYQKAVDAMVGLVNRYTDSPVRRTYLRKVREYRERINFLKGVRVGDVTSALTYAPTRPGAKEPGQAPTVGQREAQEEETSIRSYRSGVTWDDAVGMEQVKRIIQQAIVYPNMRPDLFPLGWPRGLLLYGPPGCGKTTLAAAVSTEIEGKFYAIDAASIMSKWLGEAEKNVASLFHQMRALALRGTPTILFIDEVDSLLGIRQQETGGEVRVRNQFLKEMDGLADKAQVKLHLHVIAATNKPWALDWGFIRRFQKRIHIPMPDHEMRVDLFKHFLRNVKLEQDTDYQILSKATENYTPSDVRDICQTAVIEVVTELFESGTASDRSTQPRLVGMRDLRDAIRRIRPSVSEEMRRVYDSWAERFKAV